MRLSFLSALVLALALSLAPSAQADEIGGSGFAVPQSEWLWGIDGLVRTPIDLSADFGVGFFGHEMSGRIIYDDRSELGGGGADTRTGTLRFEPEVIEGGFRLAGGIGYWSCCILIEPAMAFRANRPFGDDRTDTTHSLRNTNEGFNFAYAEAEIKHGWNLQFGPQMTWIIKDDTPVLGSMLGMGGLPLVFFPSLGVSHINWDVELIYGPPGGFTGASDRNFEDDAFTVGFDLDIPLPGKHANFTHALTFGFRWLETNQDHDIGPNDADSGFATVPPGSGCTVGTPALSDDQTCFNFDSFDGWRVGLYYRVTWNDFEGFVKRNIFGPLD
ncbi:MAG: hypothetical protein JRH10_10560 [Deltaproteobacteria bacterium]|nr:hypothetical protein [Deltaproteobacteria bacterium]MBW2447695.1 hypothetical protein [Deltaproteobacteria bacterium]